MHLGAKSPMKSDRPSFPPFDYQGRSTDQAQTVSESAINGSWFGPGLETIPVGLEQTARVPLSGDVLVPPSRFPGAVGKNNLFAN